MNEIEQATSLFQGKQKASKPSLEGKIPLFPTYMCTSSDLDCSHLVCQQQHNLSVGFGKEKENKGSCTVHNMWWWTVVSAIRREQLLSPVGEDRDYFKHR